MAAQLLSGCSIGGKEVILTSGMGSRDVFRIDGVTFSLTEAKVYLANFQNIYGKTYGIDLWEQKFQNGKLKQYVKDVALSEMTRIVCMDLLAKEQEISLTEEEMEALLVRERFDLVVDATHPYAAEVTENIARACRGAGVEYLRLLREADALPEGAVYFPDTEAAVSCLWRRPCPPAGRRGWARTGSSPCRAPFPGK